MNKRRDTYGFTLVEVLLAMATIVTILATVYSSYFAISKSVRLCKTQMSSLLHRQDVLTQLSRQLRCSYPPASDSLSPETKPAKNATSRETTLDYFSSDSDGAGDTTLHFITSASPAAATKQTEGLFELDYKFDKTTSTLYQRYRPFTGSKNVPDNTNWQPVAENIDGFVLEFFDGQQWQTRWSFKEQKRLPSAVRTSVTFIDEDGGKQSSAGTAYIFNAGQSRQRIQTSGVRKP